MEIKLTPYEVFEAERFRKDMEDGFYDEQPGVTDEERWKIKDWEEGHR